MLHRNLTLVTAALVLALPGFAQTKGDAEALVKKALAAAKAQGADKTFLEINDPAGPFKKGELYIFVYDLNGKVMAHGGNAKLVGKVLMDSQDADGKFFVRERVTLAKAKGKGWQSYKFPNPVAKKIESKIAYVELQDGLIFGCGVYNQ